LEAKKYNGKARQEKKGGEQELVIPFDMGGNLSSKKRGGAEKKAYKKRIAKMKKGIQTSCLFGFLKERGTLLARRNRSIL